MSHAVRDSTNRPLTTAGGNCLPTTKSRAPKREQLLGPCHSVEEGKWRRPPTSPYPACLHSEGARSLASPCTSLPTPPLPRARAQAPEYRGTSQTTPRHPAAITCPRTHQPLHQPPLQHDVPEGDRQRAQPVHHRSVTGRALSATVAALLAASQRASMHKATVLPLGRRCGNERTKVAVPSVSRCCESVKATDMTDNYSLSRRLRTTPGQWNRQCEIHGGMLLWQELGVGWLLFQWISGLLVDVCYRVLLLC